MDALLTRDRWHEHPSYPEQALLLDSHVAFRKRSAWITESLLYVAPDTSAPGRKRLRWIKRLEREFDWWMRSMKSHERYEESKLYPYLTRRYGVSFAALIEGHKGLATHKDRVLKAFAEVAATDQDESAHFSALISGLHDHRQYLDGHLIEEEDLVIPLLLRLPASEFQRYVSTSAAELLAQE